MSPYQHGEVFVTEDGAETDLDLGHYERFTDANTTRASNVTAGGIYNSVIRRERRGDYLGGTVQVVPHITDEIKQRMRLIAETSDVDVVITEIGGTVGDIESLPFLEAIRQFPVDVGPAPVHVHPPHARAVHRPRRRAEDQADAALGQRAAAHRHPARHAAVPLGERARRRHPQEDRAVRLAAARGGRLGQGRRQHLQGAALVPRAGRRRLHHRALRASRRPPADLVEWREITERADAATQSVRIALVGQVRPARGRLPVGQRGAAPRRLPATAARSRSTGSTPRRWRPRSRPQRAWPDADGILVPGGFGGRGIEGKIRAVQRRARAGASRTWGSAWGCRSRSASSPATSPACRAPTRPSSTSRPSTP